MIGWGNLNKWTKWTVGCTSMTDGDPSCTHIIKNGHLEASLLCGFLYTVVSIIGAIPPTVTAGTHSQKWWLEVADFSIILNHRLLGWTPIPPPLLVCLLCTDYPMKLGRCPYQRPTLFFWAKGFGEKVIKSVRVFCLKIWVLALSFTARNR